MKTLVIGFAALAFAVLATQPAAAKVKMKCSCETNAKSTIESKSTDEVSKFACSETYSGYNGSVSVQESYLKVYVDSDNVQQGDLDMNIRFRPRKEDNCLWRTTDQQTGKDTWGGTYCNTDSYKDTGQYELKEEDEAVWVAKYSAETTKKAYGGTVIFNEDPKDARKLYMNALCVQDK